EPRSERRRPNSEAGMKGTVRSETSSGRDGAPTMWRKPRLAALKISPATTPAPRPRSSAGARRRVGGHMSSVLVTGGAGFVGSHLVDALLAAGHGVRILDNLDPQAHEGGRPRFVHRGAELITGDLRDPVAVGRAL